MFFSLVNAGSSVNRCFFSGLRFQFNGFVEFLVTFLFCGYGEFNICGTSVLVVSGLGAICPMLFPHCIRKNRSFRDIKLPPLLLVHFECKFVSAAIENDEPRLLTDNFCSSHYCAVPLLFHVCCRRSPEQFFRT